MVRRQTCAASLEGVPSKWQNLHKVQGQRPLFWSVLRDRPSRTTASTKIHPVARSRWGLATEPPAAKPNLAPPVKKVYITYKRRTTTIPRNIIPITTRRNNATPWKRSKYTAFTRTLQEKGTSSPCQCNTLSEDTLSY